MKFPVCGNCSDGGFLLILSLSCLRCSFFAPNCVQVEHIHIFFMPHIEAYKPNWLDAWSQLTRQPATAWLSEKKLHSNWTTKEIKQTNRQAYDRIYKIACAKCVCSLLNNKRNALIYVYTQAHIASIHQARARKNQRTNNSTRNFSNTHQSSYQSYIDQRWRHDQGRSVYLLRRSRRQTSYWTKKAQANLNRSDQWNWSKLRMPKANWWLIFSLCQNPFFPRATQRTKNWEQESFYSFIFMNKKCARTNLLSIIWGEFHILFNSNKWNSIVIGCQPTRGFKCMSQRYSSVVLNLLVNNGVDCLVTNRAWKAIGKCFVAIHTGVNRWLCAQTVTRMTHLKRADHLWSNRSIDRVVSHTPAL